MDATPAPSKIQEHKARRLHRKAYIMGTPGGSKARYFCMRPDFTTCLTNHQTPESAVKCAGKTGTILRVCLPDLKTKTSDRITAIRKAEVIPPDERPDPMPEFVWPIPKELMTTEKDGESYVNHHIPVTMEPVDEIESIKEKKRELESEIAAPDSYIVSCQDHQGESPNLGKFSTKASALLHKRMHIESHLKEDKEFDRHRVGISPHFDNPVSETDGDLAQEDIVKESVIIGIDESNTTPNRDEMMAVRTRLNFEADDAVSEALGHIDLLNERMIDVTTRNIPLMRSQLRQIATDAVRRRFSSPDDEGYGLAYDPDQIRKVRTAAKELRNAMDLFIVSVTSLKANMDEEDIVAVALAIRNEIGK